MHILLQRCYTHTFTLVVRAFQFEFTPHCLCFYLLNVSFPLLHVFYFQNVMQLFRYTLCSILFIRSLKFLLSLPCAAFLVEMVIGFGRAKITYDG